MTQKALDT